jgi:hypothetical protein
MPRRILRVSGEPIGGRIIIPVFPSPYTATIEIEVRDPQTNALIGTVWITLGEDDCDAA